MQCVLRNVGDVFLSWARFVGLVWYTTLFRCPQNRTSLFKVTNPRTYCVCRRNLTAGRNLIVEPKHSLCNYHHFGNTHSQQPHCSIATKCPLLLDSLAFSPHLLYIYRTANINFKFSRFSAPPCLMHHKLGYHSCLVLLL
jgi:hypothetical protein